MFHVNILDLLMKSIHHPTNKKPHRIEVRIRFSTTKVRPTKHNQMTLNGTTGTYFWSKLASDSVDHHSAEIFSIAVIVNFVSLPRISSVKSSSIFFPTMAWPKGEWMVTTKG